MPAACPAWLWAEMRHTRLGRSCLDRPEKTIGGASLSDSVAQSSRVDARGCCEWRARPDSRARPHTVELERRDRFAGLRAAPVRSCADWADRCNPNTPTRSEWLAHPPDDSARSVLDGASSGRE